MAIVDINLDRGIADCPWPRPVRDPNGPHDPAPYGRDRGEEAIVENAFLVLRNDDHLLFAAPVERVQCTRPDPGPHIAIDLKVDAQQLGGETPPPSDPRIARYCDEGAAIVAYRAARKLFRDLDVRDPMSFDRLDEWYRGARSTLGMIGLREMGKPCGASLYIRVDCDRPSLVVNIFFSFTPGEERHTCVPASRMGGAHEGGILPVCPDAGPSFLNETSPSDRR